MRVTGHNFPFHVHILWIWYGIILANSAVLCMHVRTVCLLVHGAPGECYYNTLLCCNYFSLSSVVSRAFSALWVYSKFGHHPHPLGYLCAKFCFFCSLHCCQAHGEKSCTQSITKSPSPSYLMPWEPKLVLQNQWVCASGKTVAAIVYYWLLRCVLWNL